jgi:hypothetical protein
MQRLQIHRGKARRLHTCTSRLRLEMWKPKKHSDFLCNYCFPHRVRQSPVDRVRPLGVGVIA